MNRTRIWLLCVSVGAFAAIGAHAESISGVATAVNPSATISGNGKNFQLNSSVLPNTDVTFTATFSIDNANANSPSSVTIPFTITTQPKPSGAADPVVQGLSSCVFTKSGSAYNQCQRSVTITAPATVGPYTVKIVPNPPNTGIGQGAGITVDFSVALGGEADTQLVLTSSAACATYHSPNSAVFTAVLTSGTTKLQDQTISFTVDGNLVDDLFTDVNGTVVLTYPVTSLSVGDHTVTASFAGITGVYKASSASKNLGITYLNTLGGFQQPINADGSSLFGGKVVPVKYVIYDANQARVPDANAFLYYGLITETAIGTDAEPIANTNGDLGNLLRYDPTSLQYILNWDVSGLPNGTYNILLDLKEGSCGVPHTATLSLKRKK